MSPFKCSSLFLSSVRDRNVKSLIKPSISHHNSEDKIDEANESIEKTIKDEHKYSHDNRKRLERLKAISDKRLQGELRQLEIIRKDAEKKQKALRDDFQNNRKLQKVEEESSKIRKLGHKHIQIIFERRLIHMVLN
mgnify:CR=1 FL=1